MLRCSPEQDTICFSPQSCRETHTWPKKSIPAQLTTQTVSHMERDFSVVSKEGRCWPLFPQGSRSKSGGGVGQVGWGRHQNQQRGGTSSRCGGWWEGVGGVSMTRAGRGGASAPSKADLWFSSAWRSFQLGWPVSAVKAQKQTCCSGENGKLKPRWERNYWKVSDFTPWLQPFPHASLT